MDFEVISMFPDLVNAVMPFGVAGRAHAEGRYRVRCWNPRDDAPGNYRRVDDRPDPHAIDPETQPAAVLTHFEAEPAAVNRARPRHDHRCVLHQHLFFAQNLRAAIVPAAEHEAVAAADVPAIGAQHEIEVAGVFVFFAAGRVHLRADEVLHRERLAMADFVPVAGDAVRLHAREK